MASRMASGMMQGMADQMQEALGGQVVKFCLKPEPAAHGPGGNAAGAPTLASEPACYGVLRSMNSLPMENAGPIRSP